MSKELDALKRIENALIDILSTLGVNVVEAGNYKDKVRVDYQIDLIEKSLKALEIIKRETKHSVDFDEGRTTIYIDCALECNQEEYDLLKEVLL